MKNIIFAALLAILGVSAALAQSPPLQNGLTPTYTAYTQAARATDISATTTNFSEALPSAAPVAVIYNVGSAYAYVALGSGAVTVTAAGGIPVPPGGCTFLNARNMTFVGAITGSGTTTLQVSLGSGVPGSCGGAGGGGGSGSNASVGTIGATAPVSATFTGMLQGGNLVAMTGTSGNLNVQCANCSGSGVSTADGAAFTAGSSLFAGSGAIVQTTATSNPVAAGSQGLFQMTANRALFSNLRNSSGVEIATAAAPLQVSLANTAANGTAVNVSGTVTANLGTIAGAATSALQTTGNTSLSSIDGKTPALGQALSASSVPVVLPAAQITALTPPTSVGITGTLPGYAATPTFNIGTAPTITVTGSVTANAGTNLNTSALALETGGNLASINTKTPALGQAVAASSVPVVLTALQLTALTPLTTVTVTQATGTNLHVACDVGCSSSSSPSYGATFPTTGTPIGMSQGGLLTALTGTSGNLNVQCANCSGSGVSTADGAAFTSGSSLFAGAGGIFQTTATSNPVASGSQGLFQMTANRALFTNLRNSSGVEIGTAAAPVQVSLANTGANATAMLVTGTGGTFPISGSIANTTFAATQATAANLNATVVGTGTFAVQATQAGTWNIGSITTLPSLVAGSAVVGKFGIDQTTPGTTNLVSIGTNGTVNPTTASSWGLNAQGSATTGQIGELGLAAVTTGAPAYTSGQSSPFSLTTAGALRVDASATTQPVSLASTTITGNVTVAQATAASLNATVVNGGTFATQLTGTTNNINNIAGTISLPTGAATLTGQTGGGQKTQIVDGSGNIIASTSNALNVNIVGGGGSGGTSSSFAAAFPATGTAVGYSNGTNMVGARVTAAALANAFTPPTSGLQQVQSFNMCWNGTSYDQCTQIQTGVPGTPNTTTVMSVQGTAAMTPIISVGPTASGAAAATNPQLIAGTVGGSATGNTAIFAVTAAGVVSTDMSTIGGVASATGAGAPNTGTQRVVAAQDTTTIAGSAPGTAGTPSANVVTVQGNASGTPLPVTPIIPAVAVVRSTSLEANHVIKASGGSLIAGSFTAGTVGGYLILADSATAPTAGGAAIAPVACIFAPPNSTTSFGGVGGPAMTVSSGATLVFSTSGCLTNTAATGTGLGFFSGQAQ